MFQASVNKKDILPENYRIRSKSMMQFRSCIAIIVSVMFLSFKKVQTIPTFPKFRGLSSHSCQSLVKVYRQKRLNKIEEDWRNDGGRAQKEYKKHLQFVREKRIIYFDLETTEKDHKFHPLTLNNTLDMQTLHKNKNIVLFPNM